MSRKASPVLIGGFVVGAIALAIAGIVIFGSGRFFQTSYPFVAFFEGSVNGLSVGAPVKFKGVDLGAVTHIFIRISPEERNARIPVYFALDKEKLDKAGVREELASPEAMERGVAAGLRAQLRSESLVTGILYVELDYYPGTPETRAGAWDGTPEVPTLPTQVEQLQAAVKAIIDRLDEINFKGLIDELTNAASGISQFTTSPELKRSIQSLDETLASIRDLSKSVEKSIAPLTANLQKTAVQVEAVAREFEQTLGTTRSLIAPEAPLAVDLRRALDEVRDAARSVHALADELDRNPNSIVFGRAVKGEQQ
ncbi:MAG TPA: MlaD family protein [Candidatus Binatia bacterium]|nr:MlaD family protein [Candidatus Binatia bacterium]